MVIPLVCGVKDTKKSLIINAKCLKNVKRGLIIDKITHFKPKITINERKKVILCLSLHW
jgi:hypothetical protein